MMHPYLDLSGDSGVDGYEDGVDWIKVRFKQGGTYLYDGDRPGPAHVEQMKRLARAGDGLATYINRYVRRNYSRRED
jgi:hypothetical protein